MLVKVGVPVFLCVRGKAGSPTFVEKEKFFVFYHVGAKVIYSLSPSGENFLFLDCSITHTNSKVAKPPPCTNAN